MAEVQFNWADAVLVDYKVMAEEWQYYKLSDGSTIKVKLVLGNLWRSSSQYNPMTGEPLYVWNSQNIVALAHFPTTLKGTPSNIPLTPETVAQNIDAPVEFESMGKASEWNAYTLADGSKLRLRQNITSIARTRLRGLAGEPIYNISGAAPTYNLTVAQSLIKKAPPQKPDSKSSAYA